MGKIFNILYWMVYNNTPHNIKDEIIAQTTYYQESFRRRVCKKPNNEISIDLNKVENAIQSGIQWLEHIQRKDGCIGGKLWEVWDTANAVLALTSTNVKSKATESAVNFLLRSQLDNGGFFYENFPASRLDIKDRRDLYCIETTPVALIGIYKYEKNITPEVKKGLDFLFEKQKDCGGWELPFLGEQKIVNTDKNYFPSVTGYALRAILLIDGNHSKSMLEKALDFIDNTQHKDGSWGRAFTYYNTEGYPIRNMISALTSMQTLKWDDKIDLQIQRIIKSAILYTKRMQNFDGSWSARSISSKEISTSLYLQALLNADDNDKTFINLATDWLLKHQEEKGFWKGGYYGHLVHPYLGYLHEVNNNVFATSEAIVALSEFKKLYGVT